jgi:hypothetical protein
MNPTIISFDIQNAEAARELAEIVPIDAIRLSPLTYLLLSAENVSQVLAKLGQAPKLQDVPYIAFSIKTPTLRHSGHDKAAQVLRDIGYESV